MNDQNIKTGAFIEFDTIKFENVFQKINDLPLNVYLYNRRRPIYWNKKSLSIIKNSKIIPYLDSRKDSNVLENIVKRETHIIWNKISEYLDLKDRNFESFLNWIIEIRKELEIPHKLSDVIDIKKEDLDKLSLMAFQDPSTSGNPKKLKLNDLKKLYEYSIEGKLFI